MGYIVIVICVGRAGALPYLYYSALIRGNDNTPGVHIVTCPGVFTCDVYTRNVILTFSPIMMYKYLYVPMSL